jgi:hypothetical protein
MLVIAESVWKTSSAYQVQGTSGQSPVRSGTFNPFCDNSELTSSQPCLSRLYEFAEPVAGAFLQVWQLKASPARILMSL